MRLSDYMSWKGETPKSLAEKFSPPITPSMVRQVVRGEKFFGSSNVRQLFVITGGAVTAQDLYGQKAS